MPVVKSLKVKKIQNKEVKKNRCVTLLPRCGKDSKCSNGRLLLTSLLFCVCTESYIWTLGASEEQEEQSSDPGLKEWGWREEQRVRAGLPARWMTEAWACTRSVWKSRVDTAAEETRGGPCSSIKVITSPVDWQPACQAIELPMLMVEKEPEAHVPSPQQTVAEAGFEPRVHIFLSYATMLWMLCSKSRTYLMGSRQERGTFTQQTVWAVQSPTYHSCSR